MLPPFCIRGRIPMKIHVDVIPYSDEDCICIELVPDAKIKCRKSDGEFLIQANREGLQFLAKVCLTLAQEDVPAGNHVHFDGFDFFESDNVDITIERA